MCYKIPLNFSNKKMEQAFHKLKDQSKLETLQATLCFWFVFLVSFSVVLLLQGQIAIGSIFGGALVIIIIMLCFNKKLKPYSGVLTVIITFLLSISSLLYSVEEINEGSNSLQFLRGWSFASAQIVLVNQFPSLRCKILFIFIGFGIRYTLMGVLDDTIFEVDVMVRNVLTDIFVIYIYHSCERREREIFQIFFNYREELTKFKELVDNHFPQSVVILDQITKKPLFSNQYFAKIFKAIPMEAHLSDEKSDLRPVNQIINEVLQYLIPKKNTLRWSGVSFQPVCHFSNPTSLLSFLQDLITHEFFGFHAVTLEARYKHEDQNKSFDVAFVPLTWDKEKAIAIVLNDTTYQENARALKQADENKDLVIATISHELRTPLNGIIGVLDMAEAKTENPEVLKYLSVCKDNSILLMNLVNSILDLQQIRHKRLRLNISIVDIRKLLQETVNLFTYQTEQKGLDITLEIDNNVPVYVSTDENRLKQILINLIGNAFKFTLKGKITVKANQDDENSQYMTISVIDTGIGIKEENKHKLFRMYGKLEDEIGVNRFGAGLGLTIADTLARILSKTKDERAIVLESHYGEGSTFAFKILKDLENEPVNVSDQEPLNPKTIFHIQEEMKTDENYQLQMDSIDANLQDYEELVQPTDFKSKLFERTMHNKIALEAPFSALNFSNTLSLETMPLANEKKNYSTPRFETVCENANRKIQAQKQRKSEYRGNVLIVDDNPFNLMVAKHCVESLGFQVLTALSGQQAIEKAKISSRTSQPISFILMDCQMPIMDGFETTLELKKKMKSNEVYPAPIIALTANNTEEDVRRCFESGMVAHIAKPLRADDLRKCINKLGLD